MKRKIGSLFFVTALMITYLSSMTTVFAASTKIDGENIIAAQGLFTTSKVVDPNICKAGEERTENILAMNEMRTTVQTMGQYDVSKPLYSIADYKANGDHYQNIIDKERGNALGSAGVSGDKGDKLVGMLAKPVGDSSKSVADNFLSVSCESNINLPTYLLKLTAPVNVTNNQVVMKVVGAVQLFALGASILFIVIYGTIYTFGNSRTMNPAVFAMRLFFVLLATFFFPYLAQDILNLNNVFVSMFSTMPVSSGSAVDAIGSVGVPISVMLLSALSSVLGTLATAGASLSAATGGLGAVAIGAVILVIIVMIFKPLIQIIMWWYLRFIMIMVLVCLGPIFIIMLILPQTSRFATKWLTMFIGETFSQTIMIIVLFLFTNILLNLHTFNGAMGIGFVGDLIMVYAMMYFFADVPRLSKDLIGGGGNIGSNASDAMALAGAAMATSAATMAGNKVASNKAVKKGDENLAQQKSKMNGAVAALMGGASQAIGGGGAAVTGATSSAGGGSASKAAAVLSGPGGASTGGSSGGSSGEPQFSSLLDQDGNPIPSSMPEMMSPAEVDQASADFSQLQDHTRTSINEGVANGFMPEARIENAMVSDLMHNKGMSQEQATSSAQNMIRSFENQNKVSLGSLNQMGAKARSGELTSDEAKNQLTKSMQGNGVGRDEIDQRVSKLMENTGLDQLPNKTTSEASRITPIAAVKMDKLQVFGGGGRDDRAYTPEQVANKSKDAFKQFDKVQDTQAKDRTNTQSNAESNTQSKPKQNKVKEASPIRPNEPPIR